MKHFTVYQLPLPKSILRQVTPPEFLTVHIRIPKSDNVSIPCGWDRKLLPFPSAATRLQTGIEAIHFLVAFGLPLVTDKNFYFIIRIYYTY
jgi:hypothetical protein